IDFALQSGSLEKYRRALTTSLDALTRANKLTLRLLAFAEGRQGDASKNNITKTIKEYARAMETKLSEKNITLQQDLQEIDIHVPANQIQSILENIIDNACEAMPQGGNLHIDLKSDPHNKDIVLRVCDTGPGIDENNLDRVFEPFFTTKYTSQYGQNEHTGLGLAVVHGIVKELGGSVTLTKDNKRTICTVRLPLK
ncbi:MAG: sensor histidine kinase, partial [Planctomycetota bacterium]